MNSTESRSSPLLYSAEMVRARRSGLKTMTRRVIDPQPAFSAQGASHFEGPWWNWWSDDHRPQRFKCRYGQVGDSIWVKENWRAEKRFDKTRPLDIPEGSPIWHEADGEPWGAALDGIEWGRLRPSIFMRRWMSRQEDVITGIRAQRLHAITEADARAEGVRCDGDAMKALGHLRGAASARALPSRLRFARTRFIGLWESINGERSPWLRNDWVWVLTFPSRPRP